MTDVRKILDDYRASGRRIAVAESCTGGMLSAALTTPAGASDVFLAGFVTYSNRAKSDQLGVQHNTLVEYGAVSEPVAKEMAQGALQRSGADVAVSVTGIAGPGASEHKPEGRVCFGLATNTANTVHTETVEFGALGRDKVRQASVDFALQLLSQHSLQSD